MITLKDLKQYYDDVYYAPGQKFSRKLEDYRVFIEYLHPKKGGRILDVSCGNGLFLKAAETYYGLDTYGIDLSERAISETIKNTKFSKVLLANGEDLPYKDNVFDYVTNLGSLEHYLNPEKGLQEIARVCKPDGKICIVLPNYYFLLNIIYALFKGDHLKGYRQINERVEPLKRWLQFLKKEDLIIEKIYQDKGDKQPSIFEHRNIIKMARRAVKKIILALTPLNLTYQFVFICRKARNLIDVNCS